MGDGIQIWDRQPGEGAKAYSMFREYLEMGSERSFRKLIQKCNRKPSYLSQVARWSREFGWVYRIQKYEEHLSREADDAKIKLFTDMNERHINEAKHFQKVLLERFQNINPDELTPSDMVRFLDISTKVERIAMGAPSEVIRQEHSGIDGKPIEVSQPYDFSRLSADELRNLLAILDRAKIVTDSGSGQ